MKQGRMREAMPAVLVLVAAILFACGTRGVLAEPFRDVPPRSPVPQAPRLAAHCPDDGAGLGIGGMQLGTGAVAGRLPDGFAPVTVIRCRQAADADGPVPPPTDPTPSPAPSGDPTDGGDGDGGDGDAEDGPPDATVVEEVAPADPALLAALALQDQQSTDEHLACAAVYLPPLYLLLVDARGDAHRPRIPEDPCGHARSEVIEALDALTWQTRRTYAVDPG